MCAKGELIQLLNRPRTSWRERFFMRRIGLFEPELHDQANPHQGLGVLVEFE